MSFFFPCYFFTTQRHALIGRIIQGCVLFFTRRIGFCSGRGRVSKIMSLDCNQAVNKAHSSVFQACLLFHLNFSVCCLHIRQPPEFEAKCTELMVLCELWGLYGGVTEDSGSNAKWGCLVAWVVSGVWVECIVLPYFSSLGGLRRIENKSNSFETSGSTHPTSLPVRPEYSRVAFLKLWSAGHKWSSGSALVVLLDWTLVQKRQKKIKLTWIAYHTL